LFKKGATADTNTTGAIHVAFGIFPLGTTSGRHGCRAGDYIELRKTWKYVREALYFREPDGHLPRSLLPR
jgi:hypothetical protein